MSREGEGYKERVRLLELSRFNLEKKAKDLQEELARQSSKMDTVKTQEATENYFK